jgi:hypothetical protein
MVLSVDDFSFEVIDRVYLLGCLVEVAGWSNLADIHDGEVCLSAVFEGEEGEMLLVVLFKCVGDGGRGGVEGCEFL